MGMIDRGAELGWISQYPHEAECLFAPLTGIEVQSTRVDNSILVVEERLSVNLNALTIEQVRHAVAVGPVICAMHGQLACGVAQAVRVSLHATLGRWCPNDARLWKTWRPTSWQTLVGTTLQVV